MGLYIQTIFFSFTNWDDPDYIINNLIIQQPNIEQIFFKVHHGHYHPLTWISLAIDYTFFELKPWGYHLHNVLLHSINVLLVFYLINLLIRKSKIAFLTALMFSIHPFVNESVSWVTERKNLLYTLFFLLSIIMYIRYINYKKLVYFILSILCFILSGLSKGSAMVLPIVLLGIIYYKQISFRENLWTLLPMFFIALFVGYMAMIAQKAIVSEVEIKLNLNQQLYFTTLAMWYYFIKAWIPFNLSPYHPMIYDKFSIINILGLLLFISLIILMYVLYKRRQRELLFGIYFFLINIIMFFKIGNAYASSYFMAERYTYVAYIGLFFAFFVFIENFLKKKRVKFILFTWVIIIYIVSFGYGRVWKDSIQLWQHVLKYYPQSDVAWLNYGNALRNEERYYDAIYAYEHIKEKNPLYYKMLENKAFCFYKLGEYEKSLKSYYEIVKYNPERLDIKQYIATIFYQQNNLNLSYRFIKSILEQDSTYCGAWNSLGNYYYSKLVFDSAYLAYSRAIACKEDAMFYYNRANVLSINHKFNDAINDYNKAIALDSSKSEFYHNRAITFFKMNRINESLNDFAKALQLSPNNAEIYENRANLYVSLDKWTEALKDIQMAMQLNPANKQLQLKKEFIEKKIRK